MPYKPSDFNGLAFGDQQQGHAVICIIPLASSQPFQSSVEAFSAARSWLSGERKIEGTTAFMGWVDSKFVPGAPGGWTGIIGRGEDLSILFRWSKKLTVTDALKEIEQAENGLPPWLCSSLYTASIAIDRKLDPQLASSAVYYAYKSCSQYSSSPSPSFLSRSDLERLVDSKSLVDLLSGSIPEIRSGTDYARFVHLLGSRILDDKWYLPRRVAIRDINQVDISEQIGSIGACRLSLETEPKLTLSSVSLRISIPSGNIVDMEKNIQSSPVHRMMVYAIAAYDLFIQMSPPASVLRAFFPSGKIDGSKLFDVSSIFIELHSENHPSALHLANSLIEETEQKASFAPQGMYRVLLPKELSLSKKGVSSLNIYFDADRLWVQLLRPYPCPTLIPWSVKEFRKNPSEYPNSFSLMMAAINRDFRVAAEDCFPVEAASHSPLPLREPIPSSLSSSVRSKGISIRMLPVSHDGHRVWGYQSERDYLLRRRHLVGAFRRRLPGEQHRRENALDLAAEFGIVLPDEHFTIVLPHARGGNPARVPDASNTPVVRSRGLAATLAFDNFIQEEKGNKLD